MKQLSKRNLARIIAFLSAGVLALALFTVGAAVKAKEYERTAEAMYRKNLAQAGEYLADMDNVLLKGLYSESAANQSMMCADLWRDAYEAKNAISSLPVSDIDMESCYTYLSKVAEFARATEKKIAAGQKIDNEDFGTFLNIKKKTATLANGFGKIETIYAATDEKISGGIDFSFAVPRTIASSSATSEGLNALNKNMSQAPKLIYDGPYSDAVNEKEPEMLKGKKTITLKQATAAAEKALRNTAGTLKYAGMKKGNIPSYTFQKGNVYAQISARGGKLITFNSEQSPAKTVYSLKECKQTADAYLKAAGFENMRCDYYETANRILILNYHAVDSGVNCYTDLIKLKVSRESGQVCGFDAGSYYTNHKDRSFDFKLSENQAKESVSKHLKIQSVKKALIPTESEKEALCYEFRCITAQGEEMLVFIGAADGKEEDVLILQITQNGVLTK